MKSRFQIIFLFLFYICTVQLQAQVKEADSLELVNFYHTTGGDNWTNNSNWLTASVAEWSGITLSEDGTNVVGINITNNNLTGTLPNLQMDSLAFLNLDTNKLSGNIPNFAFLPELVDLSLYTNELNGNIPNFDQLANLESLDLGGNQLTATIPDFAFLPKLAYLNLDINELSGAIPNFNYLPNLVSLNLQSNQLSGTIPNFNHLPNLGYLALDFNQLSGSIPNFNFPELTWLLLSGNQLSDTIPNFNQMPNLDFLDLHENQLSGTVPNFDQIPNLTALLLKNNQLSGTIPNFDQLPKLRYLWLSNNQLIGTVPNFEQLPELVHLKLSDNQLSGTIPSFEQLIKLVHLTLSNNQLSGTIPNFEHLSQLVHLLLSDNDLSGILSNFSYLTHLEVLHLRNTNLTFSGLEENVTSLDLTCNPEYFDTCFLYAPQASIPLSLTDNTLSVSAGGTLSNNTYTWFKDKQQIAQILGDSTFTVSETGVYYCTITNKIATQLRLATDSVIVDNALLCNEKSDCVWPGDADKDGIANCHDLLSIGRAYGTSGMERIDQTIDWETKYCAAWDSNFVNRTNYKHADCNGDGIINEEDKAAIYANYSQYNKTNLTEITAEGVPLFVEFEETVIDSIEHIYSIQLGDLTTIAENVYGIAFSLHITIADATVQINDPALIFSNSWFEQEGGNVITLDTCFNKNKPTNEWTWDIAITRTSHTETTGYGEICKVACIMDIISIDGKTDFPPISMNIAIENVSLRKYNEEEIAVNTTPQTIVLSEPKEEEVIVPSKINLFPNPILSNQYQTVNISYPNQDPILIRLYDVVGKVWLEHKSNAQNHHSIALTQLPKGTYFVALEDAHNNNNVVKKLLVL